MFELTCPWDSNVARSHTFKEEKYAPLVADLARLFKVSAKGQITKENRTRIKALVWRVCRQPKGLVKCVTELMSKAALLTPFSLFSARKEPTWSSPGPLVVRS